MTTTRKLDGHMQIWEYAYNFLEGDDLSGFRSELVSFC